MSAISASTDRHRKKSPEWFIPVLMSASIGIGAWAHTILWTMQTRVAILENEGKRIKEDLTEIKSDIKGTHVINQQILRELQTLNATRQP
jgi:hypothetical protein